MWGIEKCVILHPLNPSRNLMLKNMNIMFEEIGPRFRKLGLQNTLLIDDCP
jgi:hypothetical protein